MLPSGSCGSSGGRSSLCSCSWPVRRRCVGLSAAGRSGNVKILARRPRPQPLGPWIAAASNGAAGCSANRVRPAARGNGRAGAAARRFGLRPPSPGDRVYCVGSRGDRGLISCWDAQTGQRLWSSAPAGYRATFSSPVISGQYLLCGEGLHDARMARVVCIDLAPPRAGRIRWTFATNGHVECTPVVVGDRVYVGAGDDGVYCLRLDPSASDRERVVWHAPGNRYPDAETGLAVWRDRVFVGLGEGGNAVCVLDAATGEELARRTMPYPVFSPPAVDGGQLLVGMGRGNYVRPVDDPAGSVRCLDPLTLGEQWSFPLPATVLGAVALTSEHVVVGCCDGCVYLLDRSGQLLRKWNSGAPIVAAPAVTDRLVVVVNQDWPARGVGWALVAAGLGSAARRTRTLLQCSGGGPRACLCGDPGGRPAVPWRSLVGYAERDLAGNGGRGRSGRMP